MGLFAAAILTLTTSCAGLHATATAPIKALLVNKKVAVFPFEDPYYKGRQLSGIGSPFASVFTNQLSIHGVSAAMVKNDEFDSRSKIDLGNACEYARQNNFDYFITGVVTEWIDGATQWSGTVDVAALSVEVYQSDSCDLVGSASGREKGRWFTFVNAPTTRFYQPLSEQIVAKLLNK